LAALLLAGTAHAQDLGPIVTVTGRAAGTLGVGGFLGQPLARAPLQGLNVGEEERFDRGIATLGGLTKLDASIGDAYNAEGYWTILAARGYTLDNRYNYRRDGLPINAETAIALDNKDRLELLKGTSGIQAGTSAPGGLVNLVVKRPGAALREGRLEWRQSGTLRAPRPGYARHAGSPRARRSRCRMATAPRHPVAGRSRVEPPAAAQRRRLQPAGRHGARRALAGPAREPEPPAVEPAGGDGGHYGLAALAAAAGRRLAGERACHDAALAQ
jgi:hypothetical protein